MNAFLPSPWQGMEHLHRHNIVHRDLAARNLLLDKSHGVHTVKVCDFGLSRYETSQTRTNFFFE